MRRYTRPVNNVILTYSPTLTIWRSLTSLIEKLFVDLSAQTPGI
jgi:hypothetical protein